MRRVEKLVKEFEESFKGKKVLEIACGYAEFSAVVAQVAEEVCCIDLERTRLCPEIDALENVHFFIMDARNLKFEDKIFDTVMIYNAAKHIEDYVEEIILEAIRVVRHKGDVYVISTFMIDKPILERKVPNLLQENNICYEAFSFGEFSVLKIAV